MKTQDNRETCWVCGNPTEPDIALCRACRWEDFEAVCLDCARIIDKESLGCRDIDRNGFICTDCSE